MGRRRTTQNENGLSEEELTQTVAGWLTATARVETGLTRLLHIFQAQHVDILSHGAYLPILVIYKYTVESNFHRVSLLTFFWMRWSTNTNLRSQGPSRTRRDSGSPLSAVGCGTIHRDCYLWMQFVI